MTNNANIDFTATDFDLQLAKRRKNFVLIAVVLSAIFTATLLVLEDNIFIPLGLISVIVLMGLAWQFPRTMFYIMLVGSCMIETFPLNFPDSATDLIPIFWDVNTIFQNYLKLSNFHFMPLSLFEVLLIISAIAWFLRGLYFRKLKFKFGTLIVPIMLYVGSVVFALFNGLVSGGAFNTALFEVRAQIYFLFAYLMAVNSADDDGRQLTILLWTSAIAIGVKGILSTLRFLITLKGVTIPEIGIGAHEESFFFDCFIFQLLVLKMGALLPKLRQLMLVFLPFVIIANLANERRAATAALAISLITMLLLSAFAFPHRRKAIAFTTILISAVAAIYLPLYWNGTGTFAQPARAIKSQFSPDPRDASSNAYRDAENSNLMFTLRMNPILGYGYGKPILENTQMVDLSMIDPLIHFITHNQILWVWMRTGTIGFYFFWIMICSILIQGCRFLRNPNAPTEAKAGVLIGILIIVMQMVFGLLDMQISNIRNMLYCGLWVGMISALSTRWPWPIEQPSISGDARSTAMVPRWHFPSAEKIPS
jgi:hypothetical protein